MCEAHWPFDACSYGGQCNETLGVCVCNEGYRRSSRLFDLDEFDCVTPDILVDIQVHVGMLASAASIVVLCWTMKSKNYFVRLSDTQTPAQTRRYQRCAVGALLSDVSFLLTFVRLRSHVPVGRTSYMTDIYLTVLLQASSLTFWLYLLDFYLISARNVIRLGLVINAGNTDRKLKWAETHGWYIMVFLTLVLALGTPIIYTVVGAIPGVQFNLIVLAAITLNGSYSGISTSHCLINCLDVDLKLTTEDSRSSIENQRVKLVKLRKSHVKFIKTCKHASIGATLFALLFLVWPWMQGFASAHVLQACVNGACFNIITQRLLPRVMLKSSRKRKVFIHWPRIASTTVLASKGLDHEAFASAASNQELTASSDSHVSDK